MILLEEFKPETMCRIVFLSTKGEPYFDEFLAKYASCTHRKCTKCGEPTEKTWTICSMCREKIAIEKYAKLPIKEWNGEPLYSQAIDHYFYGNDLEVYLEDSGDSAENLRLVFCEPEHLPQIQVENWDLHEDYTVAPEVEAAVKALNELLAKQPPHCWYPGKVAAKVVLK